MTAYSEGKIYDRVGREYAVNEMVDVFYEKIMADDRVSHFFDGMDVETIKRHQKALLTTVFGGPENYEGRGLREAHQKLVEKHGMNELHFEVITDKLRETMEELNFENKDVTDIINIAYSVKAEVLNE